MSGSCRGCTTHLSARNKCMRCARGMVRAQSHTAFSERSYQSTKQSLSRAPTVYTLCVGCRLLTLCLVCSARCHASRRSGAGQATRAPATCTRRGSALGLFRRPLSVGLAEGEERRGRLPGAREGARLHRLHLREPLRRDWVEAVARLHGGVRFVVDACGHVAQREEEDVAFVGADRHLARRVLGQLVDGGARGASGWVEPPPVVDLVRDELGELPEEGRRAPV
mmetsp:Transcript_14723/g.33648  ORF Transcript_14723/g.33648 Transcript_14723/m.33648 type:complete len:224 (-) Transcript_14723:935-1606(-)